MASRTRQQPGQLGLLRPDSDWVPPTELPDLRGRPSVALDTETRDDGLEAGKGPGWALGPAGYLCGVSWSAEDSMGYAPVAHPETECFPRENVIRWVDDLARSGTRIIMHNSPYDTGWTGVYGASSPVVLEDTAAGCVMLDENEYSYSLENCCARAGIPGKDETLLAEAVEAYGGSRKNPRASIWRVPARYVGPYAEQDAVATRGLWGQIEGALRAQEVWDAYRTEMDLVPMVVAMRLRGIRIDAGLAYRTAADFRATARRYLAEIGQVMELRRPATMEEIRSPRIMEQWCDREKISFPRTSGGKTGRTQGSFSKEWMANHKHPLPRCAVMAEKFEEAAGKFIENFMLGFAVGDRIHAEVHQFRSDTGGTRSHRFSYSEPPLQQMNSPDKDPRDKATGALIEETAIGTRVRRCFLPEKGDGWLAADYCHDDQTEVLSRRGWVLFADLTETDEVAQQWPDGRIDFVVPSARYAGVALERRMVRVRGARQLDFLVTPNHRMIVDGRSVLAESLGQVSARSLPSPGVYRGGTEIVSASMLRLVVALQADAADRGGTWRFYLSRPRKLARLREILEAAGVAHRWKERANGDKDGIVIDDCAEIRRFLGAGKVFRLDALLGLSPELRSVFLEELGYWDGSRNSLRGSGHSYGSTVLENVDVVSAVAALTGWVCIRRGTVVWQPGRKPYASVTLRQHGFLMDERVVPKIEPYAGQVYCVTVPSHVILTRRCGRVLTSGQSQQEPRLTVHFAAVCRAAGADAAVDRYLNNPRTDYHTMVAEMTGRPRPIAKILNLGMTYGKGKRSLAEELEVPLEEAEGILRDYHERLPFIKALEDICKRRAGERGFIRLIDGARMHYPQWEGGWVDWDERKAAEAAGKRLEPTTLEEARKRQQDPEHPWSRTRLRRADTRKALNNLIQGSAARQTKRAMLAMWREGLLPLIQMHDEIGLSVGDEATVKRAGQIMAETTPLVVPTIVDLEVGPSWGTAKMSWTDYAAKYRKAA